MAKLTPKVIQLLQKKAFAHFATLMEDGSPHVSPVWVDVDVDADRVLINSAKGRLKDRNVTRDPRVAISATDPENPYSAVNLRGRVVEMKTEGADAHIDAMAKKYMDVDTYPYRTPEEVRVIYVIEVDRIAAMN